MLSTISITLATIMFIVMLILTFLNTALYYKSKTINDILYIWLTLIFYVFAYITIIADIVFIFVGMYMSSIFINIVFLSIIISVIYTERIKKGRGKDDRTE